MSQSSAAETKKETCRAEKKKEGEEEEEGEGEGAAPTNRGGRPYCCKYVWYGH